MSKTLDQVFEALDRCLEAEQKALVAGDIETVSKLLDEKSALIAELNAHGATSAPALGALRAKAERNQILLDGALEGIRRVADRLSDLQRLRHSFDTYDQRGQRNTIDGRVNHHVEKRA
jgi:flagellar biosynthesis/type III secretory pathway chaperone